MGKMKELDAEIVENSELVALMVRVLLRNKSKGFQVTCMLSACACFVRYILENEILTQEDFSECRREILKFLLGFSGKIFQSKWKGNDNE